jgi:hypothetical protein
MPARIASGNSGQAATTADAGSRRSSASMGPDIAVIGLDVALILVHVDGPVTSPPISSSFQVLLY